MSCGTSGGGFVEGSASFGAGADRPHFSKPARSGTPAGKQVDCEEVVGEDAASGTGADLVAGLAADFGIGFGELRLGVEAPVGFGATLGLGLESDFAAGADCFWKCSGSALEMDEASFAPKLDGMDDDGKWIEAGATGAATGMRVASTRIGVPRVRLHSMRQLREVRLGLGR